MEERYKGAAPYSCTVYVIVLDLLQDNAIRSSAWDICLSHGIIFYRFPTISRDFHADGCPGVPSLEDAVRYLFAAHLFGLLQRSVLGLCRLRSLRPCHVMFDW